MRHLLTALCLLLLPHLDANDTLTSISTVRLSSTSNSNWQSAGFTFNLGSKRLSEDPSSVSPAEFEQEMVILNSIDLLIAKDNPIASMGYALVNSAGEIISFSTESVSLTAGEYVSLNFNTEISVSESYSVLFVEDTAALLAAMQAAGDSSVLWDQSLYGFGGWGVSPIIDTSTYYNGWGDDGTAELNSDQLFNTLNPMGDKNDALAPNLSIQLGGSVVTPPWPEGEGGLIPEPQTPLLTLMGLSLLAARRRRKLFTA